MAGTVSAMNPIDATDTAFLCLAIVLFVFGTPILAEVMASAICKIKIPFRKQE
jgi:hypothetical protein